MEFRLVLQRYLFIAFCLFFTASALAKPHYASIVMEYPSRTVLFSENPTTFNQPASLTKVMTLYLVFKALDNGSLTLTQPLHVSAHAANRQPSKLGLKPNETITVEEAICGLVTKSANDAASVLAENLAPSEEEFAIKMTEEAKKLGMVNTTFKNASGIANKEQITTATDMAILGAAIMTDYPHYYHFFSLREFNFHNRVFKNHNHLLGKYPGCDGIKTGFTTASGFNLLSSAIRNERRLIVVVLGGNSIKSRDLRVMQLLDIGFSKPSPLFTSETVKSNTLSGPVASTKTELETPNTTIEEEF